jgi:acyl-CoA synthetase (AMP-forming)/AMP-acid ligase II
VQVSSLGALEKFKPEYLTTVAFGSEVFPKNQYKIWREALPNARFFNLYGPTEATGMSCYWPARPLAEDETIPIGRPFRNTGILLLDDDGKEVKDGELGEICIRGTCLTMGYCNDHERTDAVFTQNPRTRFYHELIYRTGDLGYRNPHGELVFRSRKDYQIKLMGRRIELGEIEAVAAKYAGIAFAVCVFDQERQRITLFYVGDVTGEELLAYLKSALSSYMIPARIEKRSAMPLTPNGKIDRRALLMLARALDDKND